MKVEKILKSTLTLIKTMIVLLFIAAVVVPFLVTWLVEFKHKGPGLPAAIMLTCYPCLPLALICLYRLKKLLINCINKNIFIDENAAIFNTITLCCLAAAVITFAAGWFYVVFYIVSILAIGLALVSRIVRALILSQIADEDQTITENVEE